MVADNKEIDAFFDSQDDDLGGSLDTEELKAAMKRLHKAAGAADAEAAMLRGKGDECRAFAAQVQEALDTTTQADMEEEKLEKLKIENSTAVGPQLGNLIAKRNLKIGDLTTKWVKKKDVSRADFRKHVLEMGVQAEGSAIDSLFDKLDEDGGGTLDLDELKNLLTELVEMAKQAALDEVSLEKLSTGLRKTCMEQQQVIVTVMAAKAKAAKEAEAVAEQQAKKQAEEDGKREEEKQQMLAHRQSMKESKAAQFAEKIAEKRRKSLGAAEAAKSLGVQPPATPSAAAPFDTTSANESPAPARPPSPGDEMEA